MKKQPMQCPKCSSPQVEKLNIGKKGGAAFGALAGIAASATRNEIIGKSLDAAACKMVSSLAGSTASITGQSIRLTGEILVGGLAFAAVGLGVGMATGALIDNSILKNFKCHNCAHTFSNQ